MIKFLGLFDIIAVLIVFVTIISSAQINLAVILLLILFFKGLWTLTTTGLIFDPLGLIDLLTPFFSLITIFTGLISGLTNILLCLVFLKGITSFIKF